MNLSIQLPEILEERLAAYCHTHGITTDQAVQLALDQLLSNAVLLTPYELGAEGFGADQAHSGDVARNSQRLLRARFRESVAR